MVDFQYKSRYNIHDLLQIMGILRTNCPWDREQTHATIRPNVIEEAYEVAEAIDRDEPALLQEELGDLLLQTVFHAQIASETQRFTFDDVVDGICRKLLERHPHVFAADAKGASEPAGTSEQVLLNWDAIKRRSKGQDTLGDVLDGVAKSLPALSWADKLLGKLQKVGVTYREDKTPSLSDQQRVGRQLLSLAAEARSLGVDPEDALRRECEHLIARYITPDQDRRPGSKDAFPHRVAIDSHRLPPAGHYADYKRYKEELPNHEQE